MKKIAHIDLNAFFAQVEMLKNPSLKGKMIAVGNSERRGVVSTSSYEARKMGVFSGMPMSTALSICKGLIVIPGHYSEYSRMSKMFFGYLQKKFPILEQASIDECYIDMTDYLIDGEEKNQLFDLQMELYKSTELKCSIGLGKNRFLAKMGSDYKKPLGLTIITDANLQELLWPLSIDKMYGVGKKTAPRLKELGIQTIGNLATTKDPEVKKALGNMFEYLQGEANGFGDDVIITAAFDPKSISAERTFSEDVSSYEELKGMIKVCSLEVEKELKYYNKECKTVVLKFRTPDFVTRSQRITLKEPIYEVKDIFTAAMTVFDRVFKEQSFRLLGVGVDKVSQRRIVEEQKEDVLLQKINNGLLEGGKVFLGSKLKDKKDEDK
ncbi:MAG: DNA polymerase IV [Bacilli bacterium]